MRMITGIPLLHGQSVPTHCDIVDIGSFLVWFELMLIQQIRLGIPKGMVEESSAGDVAQEPRDLVSAVSAHVETVTSKPWENG